MPPQRLSRAVVLGGARRVPWPRLGENTLLLADELVVTQAADGRWFVAVRCAAVASGCRPRGSVSPGALR